MRTDDSARLITCQECGIRWRYGCAECAEDFAQRHNEDRGHNAVVTPAPSGWFVGIYPRERI